MLQTAYLNPSAHVLFYEVKESIVELGAKKFFKVHWLGNIVKEEVCKIYVLFILRI
jgi:hypothetical protein